MPIGKLLPNFRFYYDGLDTKALIGGKLHSFKATDHSESGRVSLFIDPDCTIPFPNPLTADALGCFPNPSEGHKIYWKTDQLLYLRLEDQYGNLIDDVDNFPDAIDSPDYTETLFTNFVINSEFYYHKTQSFESDDLLAGVDNYVADSGWIFRRNNTNGNINISIEEFTLGQTIVPFNTKYYLHFERLNSGALGETKSDLIQPILNVANFSGEKISFQLWGKSAFNNTVEVIFIQDFGTGGTPSAPVITVYPITLDTDFASHKQEGITLPSVAGKTLGTNNDDALWIGIRMPLNDFASVDITQLQLNENAVILKYDNKTPDIEAESKRTYELPDCKFDDVGAVPEWQGLKYNPQTYTGLIGLGFEKSRKYWDLMDGSVRRSIDFVPNTNNYLTYKRLWSWWEDNLDSPVGGISAGNGNAFGYGDNGFRPVSRYGSSAAIRNTKGEFNATTWTVGTTPLTITKEQTGGDYGINVYDPFNTSYTGTSIVEWSNNSTFKIANKANGIVTDATVGTMPSPFAVTIEQQGTAVLPEVTRISYAGIDPTTIAGLYWTFDTPTTGWYVWHKYNGTGTDPSVAGRTGILVEFDGNQQPGTARVTAECWNALLGTTLHKIDFVAASSITAGQYFNIYNDGEHYVPYYRIDGIGDEPVVVGATAYLPIDLISTDDAPTVMIKSLREIKSIYFNLPNPQGMIFRMTDYNHNIDPDADNRDDRLDSIVNRYPGTRQRDLIRSHKHDTTAWGWDPDAGGFGESGVKQQETFPSTYVGGNETRMVNMYINAFVKL